MKTDFNKKTAVLSVDGQSSAPVQIRGNTLDVQNQLYLGGLPHTYTAKKIGNVGHTHNHTHAYTHTTTLIPTHPHTRSNTRIPTHILLHS